MKATLKISGTIELSNDDLFDILKDHALANRQALSPIISDHIFKKYGYRPVKIQYPKEGLERIAVIIDSTTDQGARPLGIVKQTVTGKASNEGFTRTWTGLYSAVGEVLDTLRKRKKSFVSFDDLRAELLDMEDNKAKKLFVKNGEEIPMPVIKQRLAPSQIVRQSKSQPNLRGVKVDKKNQGLSF